MVISATDFDGTNDYMTRGADLTGNADGKLGLISFWYRLDGGDAARMGVVQNKDSFVILERNASDKWQIRTARAAGGKILDLSTSNSHTSGVGWHHCCMCWDLGAASSGHIFIDDVEDTVETTFTDDSSDYTRDDHGIGASSAGSIKFNGCLSEIYVNYAEYSDLSTEANRRKFVTAAVEAVDLGSDGSTPTGTAPIMYFPNSSATFEQNEGSGGDLTVTGSLAACSDTPTEAPTFIPYPNPRYVMTGGMQPMWGGI